MRAVMNTDQHFLDIIKHPPKYTMKFLECCALFGAFNPGLHLEPNDSFCVISSFSAVSWLMIYTYIQEEWWVSLITIYSYNTYSPKEDIVCVHTYCFLSYTMTCILNLNHMLCICAWSHLIMSTCMEIFHAPSIKGKGMNHLKCYKH
jgi:hypothetical protein